MPKRRQVDLVERRGVLELHAAGLVGLRLGVQPDGVFIESLLDRGGGARQGLSILHRQPAAVGARALAAGHADGGPTAGRVVTVPLAARGGGAGEADRAADDGSAGAGGITYSSSNQA